MGKGEETTTAREEREVVAYLVRDDCEGRPMYLFHDYGAMGGYSFFQPAKGAATRFPTRETAIEARDQSRKCGRIVKLIRRQRPGPGDLVGRCSFFVDSEVYLCSPHLAAGVKRALVAFVAAEVARARAEQREADVAIAEAQGVTGMSESRETCTDYAKGGYDMRRYAAAAIRAAGKGST